MTESTNGARIWALYLRLVADEEIRRPLWDYPPSAAKAVIHERRRRFGVWDDEGESVDG